MQKTPQKVKNLNNSQQLFKTNASQFEGKMNKDQKLKNKQNNRLLDCISAKQLLGALTTLKNISSNETQQQKVNQLHKNKIVSHNSYSFINLDVSFNQNKYQQKKKKCDNQEYNIQKNYNEQSDTFNEGMDFSQYMSNFKADTKSPLRNQNINQKVVPSKKRQQNCNFQIQNDKQNEHPHIISYKKMKTQSFFTPNKQKSETLDQSLTVRNLKTPIHNCPRSPLAKNSLNLLENKTHSNILSKKTHRKTNHKQPNLDAKNKIKASYKSKKILSKKQQEGKAYVPIQFRTDEYIKVKREKMAKILEQEEIKKQIEVKQCTFKPKTTIWKKPIHACKKQNKNSNITQNQSQYTIKNGDKKNIINTQQTIHFERTEKFETSVYPIKPQGQVSLQALKNGSKHVQTKQTMESVRTVSQNNYKNKKFNFLLDLIK